MDRNHPLSKNNQFKKDQIVSGIITKRYAKDPGCYYMKLDEGCYALLITKPEHIK